MIDLPSRDLEVAVCLEVTSQQKQRRFALALARNSRVACRIARDSASPALITQKRGSNRCAPAVVQEVRMCDLCLELDYKVEVSETKEFNH